MNKLGHPTNYKVYHQEQQVIVEIAARQGEWKPLSREVMIEVVGMANNAFKMMKLLEN